MNSDVKGQPVVFTTKYRGVFFGYVAEGTTTAETMTLSRARMCLRWDQSMHGVLGLASDGPNSDCRIGRPVNSITLRGVTAVIEVSSGAAKKWEAEPWKD